MPLRNLTIQVAIGIIFHQGRLLISKRKDDVHLGGLWEFPGGKRLHNENLEACVRREIWEELDIKVEVLRKLNSFTYQYAIGMISLHAYHCRIKEGSPKSISCSEFRWVLPSEIDRFPFPPATAPLVDQLKNHSLL